MFKNLSIDVILGFCAAAALVITWILGLITGFVCGYLKGRKKSDTDHDNSFLKRVNIASE